MTEPCALQHRLEAFVVIRVDRQSNVRVGGAEGVFPVRRSVVADVVEDGRSRRHTLTEFLGKTIQRCLWYSQRLEALIRECDA